MTIVPGIMNTILPCDLCPWPVHVRLPVTMETLDDHTLAITVTDDSMHQAAVAHAAQHC